MQTLVTLVDKIR